MAKKGVFEQNPGLLLVLTYVILFFTNCIVIYLAHLLFPQHVVLGTAHLTLYWALILSASELAIIDTFVIPFVRQYEIRAGRMLKSFEWMILYFLLNFITLWIIARFAHIFGLGLSSWVVAALLALILDVAQGFVMMQLEKFRTK